MTSRRNLLRLVPVLLALLAAGCAYRVQRANSDPPSSDPLLAYQTQVTTGGCLFARPETTKSIRALLSPIGDALLSGTIDQAVNAFGQALQEAAKATDDQAIAARNVEITAERFGPCLQVVRGWFHRGFFSDEERDKVRDAAIASWAAAGEKGAIDPARLRALWERRMWPAAQPDFVFEAHVVPSSVTDSDDKKLLVLAPVYARLDQPVSWPRLRPSKERVVGVYFAFHTPQEEPSAPGTANGGLTLGRLQPGVAVEFPPPVDDTKDTPNRGNDESRWFAIALHERNPKALTISALVTEHQDPSPFLQFWADVFGSAAPEISTSLQTAIVPSKREEARQSAATQAENLRTAYDNALKDALQKVADCIAGASDPLTSAIDVRNALRTFNQAARAVNRGTVSEDTVPRSTDAAKVIGACRNAQGMLEAEANRP